MSLISINIRSLGVGIKWKYLQFVVRGKIQELFVFRKLSW